MSERIERLNRVIPTIGRGQILAEFSVEDLSQSKHFGGFVMKMVEKFSEGTVVTVEDQCAILANMLQAGINIGIAWERGGRTAKEE